MAVPGKFGPVHTDHFEHAFIDWVGQDNSDNVIRFNVYFLGNVAGSPVQSAVIAGYPMVCLGGEWYYSTMEDSKAIHIGKWQTLQLAGPSSYRRSDCFRTTTLYDADGFTIENPANETIVLKDAVVQEISGQVVAALMDEPIADVNVEIKSVTSKNVLRLKTSASGEFAFPGIPDGKYKFKITKDGFKSISGFLILDRKGPGKPLTFCYPLELSPKTDLLWSK